MEPGKFAVRSWIPYTTNSEQLKDSLTIYDAGNLQGFLWKSTTGKTNWVVFQVDYRIIDDTVITEGCEVLHETSAPLQYFSIETFPMKLVQQGPLQFLFSLPATQILVTLSELPLFAPALAPLPLQQTAPSPAQHQSPVSPVSHAPRKLDSSRRAGGQQQSQNKSTSSPKSKALSSSNRDDRGQHLSRAPKKQEESHQQSLLTHHNGHESSESPPWTSLAQQSLYSRPPPEVAKEFAALT